MTTSNALTQDTMMHLLAGTTMTAKKKARHAGNTSWVGVTSLAAPINVYLTTIDPMMFGELEVVWVEMSDADLAKGEAGKSAAEINGRFTVSGIAELEKLLAGLGVDAATLAGREDTGYPL